MDTMTTTKTKTGDGKWVEEAMFLAPLPIGWVKCADEFGRPYYFDKTTSTSSWEHPLSTKFSNMAGGANGGGDVVGGGGGVDTTSSPQSWNRYLGPGSIDDDGNWGADPTSADGGGDEGWNENTSASSRNSGGGQRRNGKAGVSRRTRDRCVKSREQRINEALRTKVGVTVKEMKQLERKLAQTEMGETHILNCRRRLQRFLDEVHKLVGECEQRIELHNYGRTAGGLQDSNNGGGGGGMHAAVEISLEEEYRELAHTRQKLTNYVTFAGKVLDYLAEMEVRIHRQLAHKGAQLDLDRQCLGLSTHTRYKRNKFMPPERIAAEFLSNGENITAAQLLDHCHSLELSVRTFAHQTTECLDTDKAILKQVHRKSQMAIRKNLLESTQMQVQIKEALASNHSEIQIVLKSEKVLRAALAAQFRPLELCQRRYELRMQKPQRDAIRIELEQELRELGQTVRQLEAELQQTQRELSTFYDIQRELEEQLHIQEAIVGCCTQSLNLEKAQTEKRAARAKSSAANVRGTGADTRLQKDSTSGSARPKSSSVQRQTSFKQPRAQSSYTRTSSSSSKSRRPVPPKSSRQ